MKKVTRAQVTASQRNRAREDAVKRAQHQRLKDAVVNAAVEWRGAVTYADSSTDQRIKLELEIERLMAFERGHG